MCYSGQCKFELYPSGECRNPKGNSKNPLARCFEERCAQCSDTLDWDEEFICDECQEENAED